MLRVLDDSVAMTYDYRNHAGYEAHWPQVHTTALLRLLRDAYGDSHWRFLDLGGGTGMLADWILDRFPHAEGVVLDASRAAISRNTPHERKSCVCDSAEYVARHFEPGTFDLLAMHDFCHHVVTGSYRSSGRALDAVLRTARSLLAPGGHISVLEQTYTGWIDNLPGRIIHAATANRLLGRIARAAGARTAGVGVRFQSPRAWRRVFAAAGFCIDSESVTQTFGRQWLIDTVAGVRVGQTVHFWGH